MAHAGRLPEVRAVGAGVRLPDGLPIAETELLEQLQVNPPNLPMFKQGTAPFMGDYIDVAAAPAFVPRPMASGSTTPRPRPDSAGVPRRLDRQPRRASAARTATGRTTRRHDEPGRATGRACSIRRSMVPACVAGNAGSRNQNIYTSRITGGLLAGSPGNTKPLSHDAAARLRRVRAERDRRDTQLPHDDR